MKQRCTESTRVQDFLDGLLPAHEAASFRAHAERCAACMAELRAWTHVYSMLAEAPQLDPGPRLTERVLDWVVPARVRRRWLRTVGWTYAGSLAGSVAAGFLVASLPAFRTWLGVAVAEAPRHAAQLGMFVLNALGFATLSLANGWGTLNDFAGRIAPVPRALASLLQHPPVEVALWAAAVICVALLWTLHGREHPPSHRIDPLSLLGV